MADVLVSIIIRWSTITIFVSQT